MRPLTEDETKIFFEKLAKYIGSNIKLLIDRPDGVYCFRLHRDRVYYVSEDMMRKVIRKEKKKVYISHFFKSLVINNNDNSILVYISCSIMVLA